MTTSRARAPEPDHDLRARVRDALQEAARRAHGTVSDADGVGVTLLLQGTPLFAGSNAYADRIDEVQYRLDEGPCLSAVATARVVQTSTVGAGEPRWARFTAATAPLDLRSAVSTPVLVGDVVVGSLNLYGRAPDTFAAALTAIVHGAEEASRSVGALHLLAMSLGSIRSLADALSDRAEVDLAVGFLMDRYAMNAGAARVLLAQLARLDDVDAAAAARGLIDPGAAR